MNFWTFLDRNAFIFFFAAIFAVACVTDCGKKHLVETPGCGIRVQIDSSPKDGGAP